MGLHLISKRILYSHKTLFTCTVAFLNVSYIHTFLITMLIFWKGNKNIFKQSNYILRVKIQENKITEMKILLVLSQHPLPWRRNSPDFQEGCLVSQIQQFSQHQAPSLCWERTQVRNNHRLNRLHVDLKNNYYS